MPSMYSGVSSPYGRPDTGLRGGKGPKMLSKKGISSRKRTREVIDVVPRTKRVDSAAELILRVLHLEY